MKYIYKRVGILLGIILIFSLLITTTVYAEEYININNYGGDLEIDGSQSVYRIEGNGSETGNRILVTATSGDIEIHIKNIYIKGSSYSPFKIVDDSKANITLILEGDNILKCDSERTGLQKNTDLGENSGKLIIDGEGKLSAYGSHYGAGIGGSTGRNTANIEIRGGTIVAEGGGSGIGGGSGATGSYITISGGTIVATGKSYGPGIGGEKNGEYIKISGGTVTATGGDRGGAGIGSGRKGVGRNIEISGGNITATGSNYSWYGGAGIGGGAEGSGYNIKISGGNINATGGEGTNSGGAGIGSGGIGGGGNTISNNIIISGGIINATAGTSKNYGSVGIGGKYADNIIITGGVVTAKGSKKPGIGSYGDDTELQGTTTINGNAVVTTEGGAEDTNVDHIKGVYIPKYGTETPKQIIRGNVTLNENTTLPENVNIVLEAGSSLTISEEKTLTIPGNTTITNKGTIYVYDKNQQIIGIDKITNEGDGKIEIITPPPTEFDIELKVNPEGAGTVTGGGTIDVDTEISVIATENRGYKFENWTEVIDEEVTEVSKDKTYTFSVDKARTLTANFKPLDSYTISLSSEPENGGTTKLITDLEVPYYKGDTFTAKATPKNGYRFIKWKEGETELTTENNYNFTLENNRELIALFEKIVLDRTFENLESNGEPHTTTSDILTLTFDDTVNFSKVDIEITGADLVENSVRNIGENKYEIGIKNISVAEGEKVKVKLSSEDYNFSPTELETEIHVADIKVKILSIVPDGVDNEITTEKLTITLDKAVPLTGENIQITGVTKGDVSLVDKIITVNISDITNNKQIIEVTLNKEGYEFTNSPIEVTVFKAPTKYNITVNSNDENFGSVSGGGEIIAGENATISANANEGYKFVNWTVEGNVKSRDNPYTFKAEEDVTVVGNFRKLKDFTVTLVSDPEAGGTLTGGGSFKEDSEVTINATANPDYEFSGWYDGENLVSNQSEYNFTITENVNLTGKFIYQLEDVNILSAVSDGVDNETTTEYITITLDKEVTLDSEDVTIEGATKDEVTVSDKVIKVKISGINENGKNVKVTLNKAGYKFLNSPIEVTVFKAPKKYNLTITIDPEDSGTATGDGEYIAGTNANLLATPKQGYRFVEWNDGQNRISTENSINILVEKDLNLTAKFEEIVLIEEFEIKV